MYIICKCVSEDSQPTSSSPGPTLCAKSQGRRKEIPLTEGFLACPLKRIERLKRATPTVLYSEFNILQCKLVKGLRINNNKTVECLLPIPNYELHTDAMP